jgi:hypothetical protein
LHNVGNTQLASKIQAFDGIDAAVRWCGYASEHAASAGTKPWHYVLVPHDAIALSASVAGLQAIYIQQ